MSEAPDSKEESSGLLTPLVALRIHINSVVYAYSSPSRNP